MLRDTWHDLIQNFKTVNPYHYDLETIENPTQRSLKNFIIGTWYSLFLKGEMQPAKMKLFS
jgi:hypothetical protein